MELFQKTNHRDNPRSFTTHRFVASNKGTDTSVKLDTGMN